VRARLFGPLALNSLRWELHTLLEDCLGALDKADQSMQHSLALQQKALRVWAPDVSVSAASTANEVREIFSSAADITYKQHKSALEHQCRNKVSRAANQADQAPHRNSLPMSGGMNHCWCPKRSEEGGVQSRLPSILGVRDYTAGWGWAYSPRTFPLSYLL
jgi:hypothetical protein